MTSILGHGACASTLTDRHTSYTWEGREKGETEWGEKRGKKRGRKRRRTAPPTVAMSSVAAWLQAVLKVE